MDKKIRLGIGSDHAGFARKKDLLSSLKRAGHDVKDYGCDSPESCDYPDFAKAVAEAVAKKEIDKGILICGTGIGMAIAANKVPGVRAAVSWNEETAQAASAHNAANVLCLPGRLMESGVMQKLVSIWLSTPFEGDRHERRIGKIKAMEHCEVEG